MCGRLMSPAHETQSMRETPTKRGRVNRYVQSVPITTKLVSWNPVNGEVYSIQDYVIKFVSDLQQVRSFPGILLFQ